MRIKIPKVADSFQESLSESSLSSLIELFFLIINISIIPDDLNLLNKMLCFSYDFWFHISPKWRNHFSHTILNQRAVRKTHLIGRTPQVNNIYLLLTLTGYVESSVFYFFNKRYISVLDRLEIWFGIWTRLIKSIHWYIL